ncbi:solute carrier family 22 member 15-like [Tubulanus polymorphus]|uniref:solute carrier family 22 member 15-like n=1 Tax=Tubulanus polymorphus TaxID=672921 RepID=UPI003DA573E1
MEVDRALSELGGRLGRWQITRSTVLCALLYVGIVFANLSITFVGWKPPHHCHLPPGNKNMSQGIPLDDELEFSQCTMYEPTLDDRNLTVYTNHVISCTDGVDFANEGYEGIVSELDLVCEQSHLPALSQTLYFLGVLFGSLFFTTWSDFLGRKITLIFCAMATATCVLTTALAVYSVYTFMALRFLTGACAQGTSLATMTLNTELFASRYRSFGPIYQHLFWAIGIMILPLLGYFITYWRHLLIAVSLYGFSSIATIWLVEESIPWLVANGRGKQALHILRKAAKLNGVELSDDAVRDIRIASKRAVNQQDVGTDADNLTRVGRIKHDVRRLRVQLQRKFTCDCTTAYDAAHDEKGVVADQEVGLKDVFRNARLRTYALVSMLIWVSTSFVYYGLTLSSTAMVGNRFLNLFLSGLVEVPACILTIFLIERVGRRALVSALFVITGVSILITAFIPEKTARGASLIAVTMTFNGIGKFCVSAAYAIIYLYAGEIFPTNFRNRGVGMCSAAARIGSMVAPFSAYVAPSHAWLVAVVFGSVSILNGLLTLTLPETRGRPLPQTLADVPSREPLSCQYRRRSSEQPVYEFEPVAEKPELNQETPNV